MDIGERKREGPNDKRRPLTSEELKLSELFSSDDGKPNNTKTKELNNQLKNSEEFRQYLEKSYKGMKAETDPEKYEQQRDERRAIKKRMQERAELIEKLRGRLGAEKRKDAERQNRRNPKQCRGYTGNFANNGR